MQESLCRLLEPLAECDISTHFHPDLSPLGWHLGHCVYTEALWLARCSGKHMPAASLATLYSPALADKPSRGQRLPDKTTLLAWARQQQRRHWAALPQASRVARQAQRLVNLPLFLLQHHAQHLETMQMVLALRTAERFQETATGAQLAAQPVSPETVLLPAGEYWLGCTQNQAYDNEQPPRQLRLSSVRLARRPVRNAEFLGFMADGGYHRRQLWSDAGWRWRRHLAALQPEHWRQSAQGGWLLLRPNGVWPLLAEEALMGINYFEAEAFARWASARLPHEYEWEAAARAGLLEESGNAWEWCQNRFHPYPGFTAFPYAGYSLPWFDGGHYVLRGGSPYTSPWIRRSSFRNFYTAEKRHIFAGCRLAFPTDPDAA